MLENIVAGDCIVRTTGRPGKASAAGGERHESQMLQETGTADIPRIGEHETAFLMECSEGGAFFGNIAGHGGPRFLFWSRISCRIQARYAEYDGRTVRHGCISAADGDSRAR